MTNLPGRMGLLFTIEIEMPQRGLQSEQSGTQQCSRAPKAYFSKELFHVSHLTDQVSSSDFI